MKLIRLILGLLCITYCLYSCSTSNIEHKDGNLVVYIEQGAEWEHDFPLFWGIKKKNSPQMAIWIEDTCGNYISTIYVTRRIAKQSWLMSKGNRRIEALPHWCHKHGIIYEDGLYSPTKESPLPDAVTGATPRGSFAISYSQKEIMRNYVVKLEVNHSTDFNDSYPKCARKEDSNYSGGKEGSGQPALIYYAKIDSTSHNETIVAKLIGHSSPDGKDGNIYRDLSGITTALNIIKSIKIKTR